MRTRAAIFRTPGTELEVCEVELEEPRGEEVLIRMHVVGICGSDLHVIRGEWPRPTPMVLGHEGAGTVEAVGDSVTGLHVGDKVVVSWAPACGDCDACRNGHVTACTTLRTAIGAGTMLDGRTGLSLDGKPLYRMTTVGALADHTLVPSQCALKLPVEMALDQAALLGCAALTGVGAVLNAGQVAVGANVVVIGAGGVGQFIIQGARLAGASRIIAVDPQSSRREVALTLGATDAMSPEEFSSAENPLLPNGADYAFEAVGTAHTAALALQSVRNGGKAILVGMPAIGTKVEIDPFEFISREKVLTGSIYGSQEPARALPRLVDYVRAGRLQLESLLGPTFTLTQVNDAIETSLDGASGRVLVKLGGVDS
jgi:S-(hydroxymethyl)glutathione dehydrogenase / alcohol dehydrogenase